MSIRTKDQQRDLTPSSQPLEAAQNADALLKIKTVTALTGLSVATIYRLIRAGEIRSIRRGPRCTRFRAGDITAWLQAQVR